MAPQKISSAEGLSARFAEITMDLISPQWPLCMIFTDLENKRADMSFDWDISLVMQNIITCLKQRGFDFNSVRGKEIVTILSLRYQFPKRYGYTRKQVECLKPLIDSIQPRAPRRRRPKTNLLAVLTEV